MSLYLFNFRERWFTALETPHLPVASTPFLLLLLLHPPVPLPGRACPTAEAGPLPLLVQVTLKALSIHPTPTTPRHLTDKLKASHPPPLPSWNVVM